MIKLSIQQKEFLKNFYEMRSQAIQNSNRTYSGEKPRIDPKIEMYLSYIDNLLEIKELEGKIKVDELQKEIKALKEFQKLLIKDVDNLKSAYAKVSSEEREMRIKREEIMQAWNKANIALVEGEKINRIRRSSKLKVDIDEAVSKERENLSKKLTYAFDVFLCCTGRCEHKGKGSEPDLWLDAKKQIIRDFNDPKFQESPKLGDPNYNSGHSISADGYCNMGCC